jgi:hypothetical protein
MSATVAEEYETAESVLAYCREHSRISLSAINAAWMKRADRDKA